MDFTYTPEQDELAALAGRIIGDAATDARVAALETGDDRMDRETWKQLAAAGILGLGIDEELGGIGFGFVEICLVLEQQGRHVLPMPLWPTLVLAAAPIARFGTAAQRARWLPRIAAGDLIATAAWAEGGGTDVRHSGVRATRDGNLGWTLSGEKPAVPAGQLAELILIPAVQDNGQVALFVLDPGAPGVTRVVETTTNREQQAGLTLTDAPAQLLGDPSDTARALDWAEQRAQVGLAALAVGVADAAMGRAAAYVGAREQFGAPLGTLPAVQLRMADVYMDVQVMRATMLQAAWLLAQSRPAEREVRSAKWWAAEAGQRVVHAVQHLHGGMGADVDYPVHRYFLWGKQLENTLGGASSQLALLGQGIAADALGSS
jgi:acyl-CoA dehydrogenase